MHQIEVVPTTKFATLSNGVKLFYREAGNPSSPTFLLLHGFPSSSFQYRNLITALAPTYHILAPDLPGFGFTEPPADFPHTFDYLADTVALFLDQLKIRKFAVYIFDYGAPTGLRLALQRPQDILAIISQNGNAYSEGFGDFWQVLQPFWKDPTNQAIRDDVAQKLLTIDATKWQYETGTKDPTAIDPAAWTLDQALLGRPGQRDIQLDLFDNYQTNVKLYPEFHKYFEKSNVPILAIWGKNDPIFIPPGAEAYKRDSKNAEVMFVDAGHFALESNLNEIVDGISRFFEKHRV
jgi:pimeloyl-ACP methyl ester carboxylesterase